MRWLNFAQPSKPKSAFMPDNPCKLSDDTSVTVPILLLIKEKQKRKPQITHLR